MNCWSFRWFTRCSLLYSGCCLILIGSKILHTFHKYIRILSHQVIKFCIFWAAFCVYITFINKGPGLAPPLVPEGPSAHVINKIYGWTMPVMHQVDFHSCCRCTGFTNAVFDWFMNRQYSILPLLPWCDHHLTCSPAKVDHLTATMFYIQYPYLRNVSVYGSGYLL